MKNKIPFLYFLSTLFFLSSLNAEPKRKKIESETGLPFGLLSPKQFSEKESPYFSSLSFIYWQPQMSGLEFAAKTMEPSSFVFEAIKFNTRTFSPHFSFNPGVKAEFGYFLPYDGWDIKSRWTYCHGTFANRNQNLESFLDLTHGLFPLWAFPYFPANPNFIQNLLYQKAQANFNLICNNFDLELARFFNINRWLSIRLHSGIKGAVLRQHFRVKYENSIPISLSLNSISGSVLTFLQSDFHSKNQFWGIGPRVGVDSSWNLGAGFQLLADSSFTILPAFFTVKEIFNDLVFDQNAIIGIGLVSLFGKIREKFFDLLPLFQTNLGVKWEKCVSNKHLVFLTFALAYEMQYWWDANQLRRAFSSSIPGYLYNSNGNFQTQGLTASASVQF